MAAENPGNVGYPFSGPVFVLTHEPPEPPDPESTFLTGDIGEAVAAALDAAGGKKRMSSADLAVIVVAFPVAEEDPRDSGEDLPSREILPRSRRSGPARRVT